MSIWVHRDKIDKETATAIYKECTIIEELSQFDKMNGKLPDRVLMFNKDETGQYFKIPYRIARNYGFVQDNPNWRQIVFPVKQTDGTVKLLPEFTGSFRDYQVEVMPEIIECLQKHNTVIIGLPPGWGKTIIAAYLIQKIGLLPIIIIKQSKVYQGWQKTFAKVLPGARVWCVGNNNPAEYDIILCMNERLKIIPTSVKKQVGVLIIDETHTIATKSQISTFLDFQPKYTIFETATLKASSFWRMAATVSGEDGVFRISKIPYNFYVINTGIEGEGISKNGKLIPSSVQKSLIENKQRKRIIQNIIFNHVGYRKFICLQTVTAEIDENIKYLNNLGITCDTLWGSKNSYNQSQVLFGTYGKISTGFDEENACDDYWTLPVKSDTGIFVNSVLSPYLLIQSMGRCMRTMDEVPAFVFLLDNNKNIKNHLNSNKWLIELTNGKIINADYRTPFIPVNPQKGIKFSFFVNQGIYFKIMKNHEYSEFYESGIFAGNDEEKKSGLIMLQTSESLMYYKQIICPVTPCFYLTLQYINLYMVDGIVINNNGLVYAKHPLFFKHMISVNMLN